MQPRCSSAGPRKRVSPGTRPRAGTASSSCRASSSIRTGRWIRPIRRNGRRRSSSRFEAKMLLQDRTALVYGGGGAVGGAVAKAFAREGARVVLAGRTRASLEAVAAAIHDAGGRAEVAPVDATDKDAVEAHLAGVVDRAGPVKIMFNAIEWGTTQGELL